ncbi:AAA family ATPase [Candidatus Uabimicrobium amorphum]|uniref:ATP-dependent Clp protease ATP-binding subunit ClpC n=1 Tax=Uabimicrobium amorphum TaxID=2596890 RepID=A0A5S9ITK5_UABAM|nr:AAA family ATPase [Candidatus Uabimicrobium amorphum]BBM87310.1 ATP-dependent Clp protease ATP-binding subunit ClpC [Candidatus Uabimicrobium amorphum]
MGSVTLEFPIFIQTKRVWQKANYYCIRPLFLKAPLSEHPRYSKAIHGLNKEIRKKFRGFKSGRNNMNELLWLMFLPDFHFVSQKLSFHVGQRYISGSFTAVWFEMQGYRVVCLPAFDNYFFILPKKEQEKVDLASAMQTHIQKIFREKRKKMGDNFPTQDYMTTKGENVSVFKMTIYVGNGPFPFESTMDSFFAALFGGHTEFEGAWEIDRVGSDLNNLYPNDLLRCFYRDDYVTRLSQIIYSKENTPVVLLGERGVGKSSIIHESIHRYMHKNNQYDISRLVKVWHIDPTRIIAGMSVVGMWQKRFEAILAYVKTRRKKVKKNVPKNDVVVFDNVIALLRIGKSAQNNMCLSDVLKTHLEKRDLQVVLETTPEKWKLVQEWDRRFSDLFQVIRIEEPAFVDSTKMILKQRAVVEKEHNVEITHEALSAIFHLQRTYLRLEKLPGSVSKFLHRIAVKYKNKVVDIEQVHREFSLISHMDLHFFDKKSRFHKNEVREKISTTLIGQSQAVDAITNLIHLIKSGLCDPEKPFATFLFIGPTGVGKTEAAKVLTRYLFTSEDKIVRFDMNEFVDGGAVSRLIGDIQNPQGLLTTRILHQPFCVLLFDEIEKAHPNIHDLLLQVLGEGRLSDALGRTIDFTKTVIIMTSNIGAQRVGQQVGFHDHPQRDQHVYTKEVENFFRPEFLNRIDEIVTFRKLSLEHLIKIARLQINNLLERDGFLRRTVIFNVSEKALQQVAHKGFDPDLGARALKRSIEKDLTFMVAEELVGVASTTPIIFDIFLHKNQFVPHIVALEKIKPFSQKCLPPRITENDLLPFLQDMKRKTDSLMDDYFDNDEHYEKDNWSYYLFKDKLQDFRNTVESDIWSMHDYESVKNLQGSVNAPPLKKTFCKSWYSYEPYLNPNEILAHDDMISYLDELYGNIPEFVTDNEAKSVEYFLKFAYIQFFGIETAMGNKDMVHFHLSSCVEGRGLQNIEYLQHCYINFIKSLDMNVEILTHDKPNEIIFVGEGPRLWDFFRSEMGIHMFYLPHQPPIPIRLHLTKKPKRHKRDSWIKKQNNCYHNWLLQLETGTKTLADYPYKNNEILRIYCPSTDDGTVTDLRTGLINKIDMSLQDWQLIFFANKFGSGDGDI